MYWYVLFIGKLQNKRKNRKDRWGSFLYLKIILKNIAVVAIAYMYWQIYLFYHLVSYSTELLNISLYL